MRCVLYNLWLEQLRKCHRICVTEQILEQNIHISLYKISLEAGVWRRDITILREAGVWRGYYYRGRAIEGRDITIPNGVEEEVSRGEKKG